MKPQPGSTGRLEALGMESSEGEYVPFGSPVLLEGPVEAWLCDVERTMRWTLREILKQVWFFKIFWKSYIRYF